MSRSTLRVSLALVTLLAVAAFAACSRPTDTSQAPEQSNADTTSSAPAAPSTPEPAPAPAVQSDAVKTFRIGDLTAMALRDGTVDVPNDNKVFGVGQTPEEVAAVLSAAGAPTDALHLSVQPLLVKTADRVLLFDTGAGANFGPGAGKLLASMADAGVDPQSVTDIFISHVHGDHIGGLVDAAGALVFPAASIHISAPESTFLNGLTADTAKNVGLAGYDALMSAIKSKIVTFAPGAEIIPSVVKAVEIKGHTPGHSGYMIISGESSLLYVGDSVHHYVVSVQEPEWHNGFDGDPVEAAASRGALLAQSSTSGQRLYAVHFPFPGIGKIQQRDDGFVWIPE
jgi:glyoxylase-like metal-dependent hydrolase (beta-lactamase superfamily II)